MSELEEREIKKTRLRLLDLVKSFFVGQPDAEKLSRWRGTFSALIKERINPSFDESVRKIHTYLENHSLEDLQNEYYELFIDPFKDNNIHTGASYYFDGKSHGQTLVKLRGMFLELGIEKNKDVIETEDSLVVILDVLGRLIDDSTITEVSRNRQLQDELLQTYLLPLSVDFDEAIQKNEAADFYSGCSSFFVGFLELEKGLSGVEVTH